MSKGVKERVEERKKERRKEREGGEEKGELNKYVLISKIRECLEIRYDWSVKMQLNWE